MSTGFLERVPTLAQVCRRCVAIVLGLIGRDRLARGQRACSFASARTSVPMQYAAAIAFAVAGVGLLLALTTRNKAAGVAGLLVGAIGLLSLTQDVLHVDPEVDHVFGALGVYHRPAERPAASRRTRQSASCSSAPRCSCGGRTTPRRRPAMLTVLLGLCRRLGRGRGHSPGTDRCDASLRVGIASPAWRCIRPSVLLLLGAGLAGRGWQDSGRLLTASLGAAGVGRPASLIVDDFRVAEPGLDAPRSGALSRAYSCPAPAHGGHHAGRDADSHPRGDGAGAGRPSRRRTTSGCCVVVGLSAEHRGPSVVRGLRRTARANVDRATRSSCRSRRRGRRRPRRGDRDSAAYG